MLFAAVFRAVAPAFAPSSATAPTAVAISSPLLATCPATCVPRAKRPAPPDRTIPKPPLIQSEVVSLAAVIGTNSIAAYLIAHLWDGFIERALVTHLSARIFQTFGAGFEQLLKDAAILLVLWLFLAWMERRKIFLRV